jgi:exonuclease SbcC
MRPLRLSLKGFTCFKEEQTLDFSQLDLFAITGTTGSGKSSLLDAMTFALYGGVPRIGQQGIAELISHGSDRLTVMLDFRVSDRILRVVRSAHRKPIGNKAMLEELRDGTVTPIADGIKNVDAEVERIVGMPYDVFTHAVVLPQGEFARFLQSAPGQRQKILRDLLRHHVYGEMQRLAGEKTRELESALESMEERLAEDFGDATAAREKTLRQDFQAAKRRVQEQTNLLIQMRSSVQEMRSRHSNTSKLAEVRNELQVLEKWKLKINSAQQKVGLARRAATISPFIEATKEAETTAAAERNRDAAAGMIAETAKRAYDQARRALDLAQSEATQIAAFRDRITKLAELKGVSTARNDARHRFDAARSTEAKINEKLQEAKRRMQNAETLTRKLAKQERDAEESLGAISYDGNLDDLLEKVREFAASLGAARRNLARVSKEKDRLKKEAGGADDLVRRKAAEVDRARGKHAHFANALREVQQRLREAEEEHAAIHLRARLKRGQPCPVCGHPVAILPARATVPKLATLETQVEKLKEEEREARKAERDLTMDLASLKASAKKTAEQSAKARAEANQRTRELEELEKRLQQRVGKAIATEFGETIELKVLNAAKRLASLRSQYGKLEIELSETRSEREKAELALENERADVERVAEELKSASRDAKVLQQEVQGLESQIRVVTDRPDPEAERRELDNKVKAFEKHFEEAQVEESLARAKMAKAEADAAQVKLAAEKAAGSAKATLAKARAAAEREGFMDLQMVEQAVLADVEIKRLESEIDSHKTRETALKQRQSELEKALNGQEVTDAELRSVENRLAELESEYQETVKISGVLEQQISDLLQRIERARDLRMRFQGVKGSYVIYRRLADDLKSDYFQAFLLDEAFRDLLAGASHRLYKLSGRYTLEYGPDRDFLVVDHDNAMERRSADTLSGGETFLASLALALELSEQVQREATAVLLESLFIDEGFGTLDGETLSSVAGAIESLQIGGRMVGIITHIEDLASRLPARVLVDKRLEGSRLRVEGV